jgi:hypothetical protein
MAPPVSAESGREHLRSHDLAVADLVDADLGPCPPCSTSANQLPLRSRGRSRLLSHLASDEAFSGPGIDDAPGIDLLTLSFVAVIDAIPLDDRRVAI